MTISFLTWLEKPKPLLRQVFIPPEFIKVAVEVTLSKTLKGKLLVFSSLKMKNRTGDWIQNGQSSGTGNQLVRYDMSFIKKLKKYILCYSH